MADSAHVTFFSREKTRCPICETLFGREELRTGRGRLIAGNLTDELRRNYEPSRKFGEVTPLLYPVTVCPSCYYAAYDRDFLDIPEEAKAEIRLRTDARLRSFHALDPVIDFNGPRDLTEGLASYFFAAVCYDSFPKEFTPTFKQGVSTLRGAWLCSDLHRKDSSAHWDQVAMIFYRKARFFYRESIDREQNGTESIPNTLNLGPDIDKNYGYDGVLYITGLLEFKYGPRKDPVRRTQELERAKRTVSRLFGMGKASKSKPSALLDMARDLFAEITDALGELSGQKHDG